jgi:hypothetical protein
MRSDYEYLKKLVDNLIEPEPKLKIEDRSSLNDYFYFLTLEGLEDEQKGIELFEVYTKLEIIVRRKKSSFTWDFSSLSPNCSRSSTGSRPKGMNLRRINLCQKRSGKKDLMLLKKD